MPLVTRIHRMDLPEIAYQISCSESFVVIREGFTTGVVDDQDAQARLLDLVMGGRCRIQGFQGEEELRWALSEAESGRLTSVLYREYLRAE